MRLRSCGATGCIDIGRDEVLLWFFKLIEMMSGGKPMTLIVDYSGWSGSVPSGNKDWIDEWKDRNWHPGGPRRKVSGKGTD